MGPRLNLASLAPEAADVQHRPVQLLEAHRAGSFRAESRDGGSPGAKCRDYRTRRLVLDSFQGKRLRGWYTTPTDPPPAGKFPGVLAVPGYGGVKAIPTHLAISGFAVLTLFPRAQGESLKEWKLEHSTKITYHLTDKENYYYRGAYMDCLRGLDFLSSQPEVDPSRLGMWSRSQGGGFTLATAALD